MLEITSRVRARAREANEKLRWRCLQRRKNFFTFFELFSIFLILLKKGRELTHFPLWCRKWQGSRHRPFCPPKMGSL